MITRSAKKKSKDHSTDEMESISIALSFSEDNSETVEILQELSSDTDGTDDTEVNETEAQNTSGQSNLQSQELFSSFVDEVQPFTDELQAHHMHGGNTDLSTRITVTTSQVIKDIRREYEETFLCGSRCKVVGDRSIQCDICKSWFHV